MFPASPARFPPELVRCLALSQSVRLPSGEAVFYLGELIEQLASTLVEIDGSEVDPQTPVRILVILACLRPAILAPISGAADLLRDIHVSREILPSLGDLKDRVLEFCNLGIELDPIIISGVQEQSVWHGALGSFEESCGDWLDRSRLSKLIYGPSTNVWREWLKPSGQLGRVFDIIGNSKRDCVDEVTEARNSWSSPNMLIQTDRKLRGRKAELRPIEAKARAMLFKRADEAWALVDRWTGMIKSKPGSHHDYQYRQVDQLRKKILNLLPDITRELENYCSIKENIVVFSLNNVSRRILENLVKLFDKNEIEESINVQIKHVISGDMLRYPTIQLNSDLEPVLDVSENSFEVFLAALSEGSSDWSSAFERHCEKRNHFATEAVLEVLEERNSPAELVEELHERREDEIARCRKALRRSIKDVEMAVERAVFFNLLAEKHRADLVSQLESIVVDQVQDFSIEEMKLEQIRLFVAERRFARITEIREALQKTNLKEENPDAYRRIEERLESGDFLVANEYIDLVTTGQSLPDENEDIDKFASFFPGFCRELENFLSESRDMKEAIKQVERSAKFGPIDMRKVPGAQAQEAARMLNAWFEAKNRRRKLVAAVQSILSVMGFRGVEVKGESPGGQERNCWLVAEVEAISDRQACAIPRFGSLGQGRYDILCAWDRPSEEELHALVRQRAHGAPKIILYFGRMTEQRRRNMAQIIRAQKREFAAAVVDEALVFYLCSQRGFRLPVLFECALPFSVTNPYTTTAGLVPAEMFFGRSRERESIHDRFGTNLVYGGRQLGKTALLRHIVRSEHQPESGSIVQWIDLKVEGIGVNRPHSDIWTTISSALGRDARKLRQSTKYKEVSKDIVAWLEQDEHRSILLLLDESDSFLDIDARNQYEEVGRLKGLMDLTDRRFKVVFAGLHNVQRTSRDINTPLAHLGSPICIGPLIEAGEWQAAHDLITIPFKVLGYRFDPPDLPTRILSLTNYYPNLIQIYCRHLLEHVGDSSITMFNLDDSPPFTITDKHIEEVYQSKEVRKAILDRFKWTLDLDPRYRVIAHRIALETVLKRSEGALVDGFDVGWIRDEALFSWREGFRGDESVEAFHTVLEEMIGLGILRRVGTRNYTLRSANVINLFGTADEIFDSLMDDCSKEPPREFEYEPAIYHRPLRQEPWRLSPLTAKQESELLSRDPGVVILIGSLVAGIDRVVEALESVQTTEKLVVLPEITVDFGAFKRFTGEVFSRLDDGLTVIVVPSSRPWSEHWVEHCFEEIRRRTSRKRHVRFVFLADPDAAWSWVRCPDGARSRLLERGVKEYTLRPWHDRALGRWLDDTGFGHNDAATRKLFSDTTGNWGDILTEFGRKSRSEPHRWKENLEEIGESIEQETEWRGRFGIHEQAIPVLSFAVELDEPFMCNDIADLMDDMPEDQVADVMNWAELVSFVTADGHDTFSLNPVIKRIAGRLQE